MVQWIVVESLVICNDMNSPDYIYLKDIRETGNYCVKLLLGAHDSLTTTINKLQFFNHTTMCYPWRNKATPKGHNVTVSKEESQIFVPDICNRRIT